MDWTTAEGRAALARACEELTFYPYSKESTSNGFNVSVVWGIAERLGTAVPQLLAKIAELEDQLAEEQTLSSALIAKYGHLFPLAAS